jgi:NDP-sugar pyrophosphorylase family protein
MDIALVYMVAGISSRFDGNIKQFARVGPNNETLIEYSLNQAIKAGFSKIVFIVGKKTEQSFREMFGDSYKGVPIEYAFQDFDEETRDRPWGTLDSLCCAENFLDCPFVVCNGDDIYGEEAFKKLTDHFKETNQCATIGYKVKNCLSENGSVNRGVFELDEENNMSSIKEIFNITKENFSEKGLDENSTCSVNIFLFTPGVINPMKKLLEEFKEKNKGDRRIECLLPEELTKVIVQKNLKIYVYPTTESFIGITNPGDENWVREILS